MKQYSKYKFSGIQWLGNIPDHWQVKRVKDVFAYIGSGSTPKSSATELYDDDGYYWVQSGDLNDGYVSDTRIKINDAALQHTPALRLYPKDSLIIAMYGATIGKLGILTMDAYTNQACCVLSLPINFNARFLFYEFIYYKPIMLSYATGGGQPNISQEDVKNHIFPLPPLAEQTSIAAYLDSKTANIDRRISLLRDKIEHYKQLRRALISNVVTRGVDNNVELKNSGIQWLGDIPKHWMVKRVKDVVTLITVSSISDVKIGLENIESGTGKFIKTDTEFDGNGVAFMENDIIYGKLRPYLQKVWIAEFEGNAVGDFFVFRAKNDVDFNFIKWWMLSEKFTKKSDGSTFGAKMPRVSSDFILNLNFPLPPLAEQTAIAAYLDEKTAQIDAIVDKCEIEIEKLSELRRSLIAQAVTGQIKVC